MTSNSLRKRLFQHITDAKRNTCSVSNKLCQKEKPSDLKRLHDYIKIMNNPNQLSITTLEKLTELIIRQKRRIKTQKEIQCTDIIYIAQLCLSARACANLNERTSMLVG